MSRTETLAELAAEILSIDRPHPVRVGIDGLSATGKTTLGDDLVALVDAAGRQAIRASLDDFKRPWSESHLYDRVSGEGYYRNAYDYDLIRTVLLEPLGPGGDRLYRAAVIDPLTQLRSSDSPQHASDQAVLLADGVFLFRPELNACWDFRIFLTMDFELVASRGAERDQAWEPSREAAEQLYHSRYIPSEQLYLREVQPERYADVILDMTDPENPRRVPDIH